MGGAPVTAGQEAPAAGGAPGSRFPGNGQVSTQPQLLRPPRNQGSGHVSVPSPSAVGGVAGPRDAVRAAGRVRIRRARGWQPAHGRRPTRCSMPTSLSSACGSCGKPVSLCPRGHTHAHPCVWIRAHTHTHTRPHAQMPSYAQTRGPAPRTHRPRRPSHARARPAARPGTREGATPTLPRHTGAALSIAHTPARVRGSAQTRTCTRTAGPESARATLAGRHRGGLR